MEKKSINRESAHITFGIIVVLLLSPSVGAQTPPNEKECIAYAYSYSEPHYFLLKSNASIFGQEIMLEHNCPRADVFVNGVFLAGSNQSFNFQIDNGTQNITIEVSNRSIEIHNLNVYPDRLIWLSDFEEWQNPEPLSFIEKAQHDIEINWAVSFSIVIVWVLATYVYWSLINSYTQRNFIEEVVQ